MSPINFNELELTVEDFQKYTWKDAVAHLEKGGYSEYYLAFEAAAQRLENTEDIQHKKLLIFLSCICSMMLCPVNTKEPYKPLYIWYTGSRSLIPADLNEKQWSFLASAFKSSTS